MGVKHAPPKLHRGLERYTRRYEESTTPQEKREPETSEGKGRANQREEGDGEHSSLTKSDILVDLEAVWCIDRVG